MGLPKKLMTAVSLSADGQVSTASSPVSRTLHCEPAALVPAPYPVPDRGPPGQRRGGVRYALHPCDNKAANQVDELTPQIGVGWGWGEMAGPAEGGEREARCVGEDHPAQPPSPALGAVSGISFS